MIDDAFKAIEATCSKLGISSPPSRAMVFDGKIHRYHDPLHDKKGDKDSWFKGIANDDGSYGGTIGRWPCLKANWHSQVSREFSPEERAEYARKMAEARQREKTAREQQHIQVAQKADTLLCKSCPAKADHPYLIHKGVGPHTLRQLSQNLIIPLRDSSGFLWSLQMIDAAGNKRFLSGGRTAGCYFSIGPSPTDTILVCEGVATGLTLLEASSLPVACAMNAGNLLAVSVALSEKYKAVKLIICADADPIGMAKAQEAAEAVDGTVLTPDFSGSTHHE